LTFVATFGPVGDRVLGLQIAADSGVAGHVYAHGRSYLAVDCDHDPYFVRDIDSKASFVTKSLLAVPIRLERSVCGVIELVNRRRRRGFSAKDLQILEIFAGYLSSAIQNAVDTQKARELARRDDLTALGNDRALSVDLVGAVLEARQNREEIALVFIDVDQFKSVNDVYGHLVGSRTLREVGASIARHVPPNATAYRYGGDEFVVLCRATGIEAGLGVAVLLHEAIGCEVVVPDEDGEPALDLRGKLSISAGVASLPPQDNEGPPKEVASELLGEADRAMYLAKENGRDRVIAAPPRGGLPSNVIKLFRP
jgi:diguanylate cyclase (GGDEF)-like protein